MHRHHTADGLELIGIAGRLQRHDHADAAEAVGHRTMHITSDHALADRKASGAAQCHVLADLGDGVGDRIRNR